MHYDPEKHGSLAYPHTVQAATGNPVTFENEADFTEACAWFAGHFPNRVATVFSPDTSAKRIAAVVAFEHAARTDKAARMNNAREAKLEAAAVARAARAERVAQTRERRRALHAESARAGLKAFAKRLRRPAWRAIMSSDHTLTALDYDEIELAAAEMGLLTDRLRNLVNIGRFVLANGDVNMDASVDVED